MYVSTVTSSTKQYLATSYRHSVSIDIVATLYPFSRLLCLYHLYRQNVIGRHEINIHSIISAILKWYDTVSEGINYYMFLRKLLNIVTFSYTIQYTELFNSSWVKYTCIHVRLKMDQDHPSFKYMYSVLLRLTTCGLFRNQPKHYVYSYMYKRAQTDFRLLKGAVTSHLWKS